MARIYNVASLQSRMILDLPGCPEVLRVQALQDALHKFCKESEAWREELDPIDLVDGQVEYDLVPQFDAHVHLIEWVKVNTEDGVTEGTDPDPLDKDLYTLTIGDPDVLTLDDNLEPTEDITDALTVKAVLVPEMGTLDVAEWFANRYWEHILAGAKAIRMMDRKKRWSDPQRGAEIQQVFLDGISEAKNDNRRDGKDDIVCFKA
jgi:hypothetical protein